MRRGTGPRYGEPVVYSALFRHVLVRLDPETAHELTIDLLALAQRVPGLGALLRGTIGRAPRRLQTDALGLRFSTPFGIAAGFDKNARVAQILLDLGFGHVEVGTVTARPQPGNPRPRLFRLVADQAVLNRMGFNNDGAEAVADRLWRLRETPRGARATIGVNIGKSRAVAVEEAVADYRRSASLLAPVASYLAINVSSPNTPNLRDLQEVERLRPVVRAVMEEADRDPVRRVPVLVKIAPDLDDESILAIARMAVDEGVAGLIASNTTITRPTSLKTSPDRLASLGAGGLSGPLLAERAAAVLELLAEEVGDDLELISVGGVRHAGDVAHRLHLGADLVQGYTGFIYHGPLWASSIGRGLVRPVGPRRTARV
jgi:dihydroorotate dehydrogenase